jgi:hypothetical protein
MNDLFNYDQQPDGRVIVRARSEDPDTSHEAAAKITANQDRIAHSVAVILEILAAYGPQSDFGLRDRFADGYMAGEQFSEGLPRMARLWAQRKGLIEQAGHTIHNGRRCRTWKLIA